MNGFPWLAEAYADYFRLQDLERADALALKSHPALRAADEVRQIAHQRRQAEKLWRVLEYQLTYYESLFPWLVEFKEEGIDDLIRRTADGGQEPTETDHDEDQDPARRWLTPGEYESLSNAEKYQRALDRYWQRRKSKWEVGKDYERYVGYQYEMQGWGVDYQGIVEGFLGFRRAFRWHGGD